MTKQKITLVIMAAGIGSRFGGGIKQLEPVGPGGEIIVDYSIYDAIEAGFNKVVFVIRKDLEEDFKEVIGNRIAQKIEVAYAYQEVSDIPSPYAEAFKERTKPWGTGQAILVCKDVVREPFVVINADDYYGRDAYVAAVEYLTGIKERRNEEDGEQQGKRSVELDEEIKRSDKRYKPSDENRMSSEDRENQVQEIAMVSFVLKNTLSDFGAVTRGICKKNEEGYLESIVETRNIVKRGDEAVVVEESTIKEKSNQEQNNQEQNNQEKSMEEDKERIIDINSLVSMNMWCFFPEFMNQLETGFEDFLENLARGESQGGTAYLKAEYLLPTIVGDLLDKGELTVKVLESKDQWFGVTYKEDKEIVVAEIGKLIGRGLYG